MDTRSKQVQVRLTPEVHRQLKSELALKDRKLVDFFNEATIAYLKAPMKYIVAINEILGGDTNG